LIPTLPHLKGWQNPSISATGGSGEAMAATAYTVAFQGEKGAYSFLLGDFMVS